MTKKEILTGHRWSKNEDNQLKEYVQQYGNNKEAYKIIAKLMDNKRSALNCENRFNLVLDKGWVKGSWSSTEDSIILSNTSKGIFDWNNIALQVTGRTAKQVRERYNNKLDPNLIRNSWSPEEDKLLTSLQSQHGNGWKKIATLIKGRSENDIKNRWNTMKRTNGQYKSSNNSRKTKRNDNDNDDDDDSILILNTKKLKISAADVPILNTSTITNQPYDSDSEDDDLTFFRKKFVSFQKTSASESGTSVTKTTRDNSDAIAIDTNPSIIANTSVISNTSPLDISFSKRYSNTYHNNLDIEMINGFMSGFSSMTNSGRNTPDVHEKDEETENYPVSLSSNSSIALSYSSLSSLSSFSFNNIIHGFDNNNDTTTPN